MKYFPFIFAIVAAFAYFALAGEVSKPDLTVAYAYNTPTPGYAWEPVSFIAYVKNNGSDAMESFTARLRIDAKRDGTWETVSTVSFSELAAGKTVAAEWVDAIKLPQGTHAAEICIDAGGVIMEIDETNNCKTLPLVLFNWYGALPGKDRALDMVFIGDRYPDMSPFYNDVASLKEYLLSREPFTEFTSQIKFHTVENAAYLDCRETTIDLYAPIDPRPTKPTGTSTTIMCDQSLVTEAVRRAGVPYDKIVVLASGMNGGTGFGIFVFTGKEKRLFVHELGHGFGLLDEYVSTSNAGSVSDTCHANCCENLRCAAWSSIPGAQCVLGCTYPNWYRSSPQSIMKSHYEAEYFNAVSADHLRNKIKQYLERVPPTVAVTAPANGDTVSGAITVSVSASDDTLVAKTEVYIDGKLIAKWYAEQPSVLHRMNWDTAPYAAGSLHTLEAKTYDLAGNVAVSAPVTVTITSTQSPAPSTTLPTTQATPLAPTPTPTIDLRVMPPAYDGDLIAPDDGRLYIVKKSGEKWFARHILHYDIVLLYPHLRGIISKGIPGYLEGFSRSAWVRLPMTSDPETWKIWEVNSDRTKHWITCADLNNCAATWIRNGGDPDGIYTVSKAELDFYTTGPNVFLR